MPTNPDLTVITYTHNLEFEDFERRLREELQRSIGDLPWILVSQVPVEHPHNICVGQIGASPENILKQLIIGAEAATTRWIAITEADCLFPPEFFDFQPTEDDCWYNPAHAYIIWWPRSRYYRKHFQELIGIVNREHAIQVARALLADMPKHITKGMRLLTRRATFWTDTPVVTIKSRCARLRYMGSPHSTRFQVELPRWGTGKQMWRKYWHGKE